MNSDEYSVAASSFASVPERLRPSLAEIEGVRRGIKPACRLTINIDDALGETLSWLRDSGLAFCLSQPAAEQLGYGPMSTLRRAELLRIPKLRIYLASTTHDARALYRLEAERYNYAAFGLALGYPRCCVEFASAADQSSCDERSGAWRQTNLTVAGIAASRSLYPLCNHLFLESPLGALGPVSAISHYPCALDCRASAAMAVEVMTMASSLWPAWYAFWIELLYTPTLHWSDAGWPAEFWDEYAGLALIGARFSTPYTWSSDSAAVPLGSGLTSAGRLPVAATSGALTTDGVVLAGPREGMLVRASDAGPATLLDWSTGTIRRAATTAAESTR